MEEKLLSKFCLAVDCMYPNYVKRFKNFNLKQYLDLDLNIPYYIQTNMPNEFSEYEDHPLIRVFDIEDLRSSDSESIKNEPLPENPKGLYPALYPWNLRRFILRKAIEDGYLGIFAIECDTRTRAAMNKDQVLQSFVNLYTPNTVKTSSARFVYKNRHPSAELFYYHPKYIEDLKLNFNEDQYDTLDGTNQIFFGENTESLLNFVNNWDFICNYGYSVPYGYKTGYLSNLSFVIPMSNFTLIHTDTPFETHHAFEDRY